MSAENNPHPTSHPAPNPADTVDSRLTRLEEHAGYSERTVEELSLEVRLLNQRMHDLAKRLDAIDGKLGGVTERIEKIVHPGDPPVQTHPPK